MGQQQSVIESNEVTVHDTSIPIVVKANKWNQFGSLRFSVRHQPAMQEVGPKRRGSKSKYWRFLLILAIKKSVPARKTMKIGMESLSPLNASGIGLLGTFRFKTFSISGRSAKRINESREASNASPWINRNCTMCTMPLPNEFPMKTS